MASGTGHPRTITLTPREIEILRLMAEGLSGREVAQRLSISAGTVANHRRIILLKLGVRNSALAVRWALQRQMIGPD